MARKTVAGHWTIREIANSVFRKWLRGERVYEIDRVAHSVLSDGRHVCAHIVFRAELKAWWYADKPLSPTTIELQVMPAGLSHSPESAPGESKA